MEATTLERQIAANVVRFRTRARLSTRQLSAKLAELGNPIVASSITKVEKAERTVSVQDLIALAIALDAHPLEFLLPEDEPKEVELTPTVSWDYRQTFTWLMGPYNGSEKTLGELSADAKYLMPIVQAVSAARAAGINNESIAASATYAGTGFMQSLGTGMEQAYRPGAFEAFQELTEALRPKTSPSEAVNNG